MLLYIRKQKREQKESKYDPKTCAQVPLALHLLRHVLSLCSEDVGQINLRYRLKEKAQQKGPYCDKKSLKTQVQQTNKKTTSTDGHTTANRGLICVT